MELVAAEAVAPLRQRWQQLADDHATLVRVLPAGAGVAPGTATVEVPPGLAEVVDVLPGIVLGGVVIDWPRAAAQWWPELGERRTYQPVWANGREAIVVRVDPATGAAGEVVHVTGDSTGAVQVCATDVVSFLQALTTWAEQEVPALLVELAPEAAEEDELAMMVEDAVEQDFATWLTDQH